ncbi:hypothetical protein ABMA70_00325 [Halobacteriovorax sp. XZX-3]|nr:hypothetical protein [Halobacteriovorax sp. DA5]
MESKSGKFIIGILIIFLFKIAVADNMRDSKSQKVTISVLK